MGKKLTIVLSEEATENYLRIARGITKGEVDADCEPSGSSLRIDIGPRHYGSTVSMGNVELGEVELEWLDK